MANQQPYMYMPPQRITTNRSSISSVDGKIVAPMLDGGVIRRASLTSNFDGLSMSRKISFNNPLDGHPAPTQFADSRYSTPTTGGSAATFSIPASPRVVAGPSITCFSSPPQASTPPTPYSARRSYAPVNIQQGTQNPYSSRNSISSVHSVASTPTKADAHFSYARPKLGQLWSPMPSPSLDYRDLATSPYGEGHPSMKTTPRRKTMSDDHHGYYHADEHTSGENLTREMERLKAETRRIENLHTESERLAETTALLQQQIATLEKENKDYNLQAEELQAEIKALAAGSDSDLAKTLCDTSTIKRKCDDLKRRIKETEDDYGKQLEDSEGMLAKQREKLSKVQKRLTGADLTVDQNVARCMAAVTDRREKIAECVKSYLEKEEKLIPAMEEETKKLQDKIKEQDRNLVSMSVKNTAELIDKHEEAQTKLEEVRELRATKAKEVTKSKEDLDLVQVRSHALVKEYSDLQAKQADQSPQACTSARGSQNAGDRMGMMSQHQRQQEELINIERQKNVCETHLEVLLRAHADDPSEHVDKVATEKIKKANRVLKKDSRRLRKMLRKKMESRNEEDEMSDDSHGDSPIDDSMEN